MRADPDKMQMILMGFSSEGIEREMGVPSEIGRKLADVLPVGLCHPLDAFTIKLLAVLLDRDQSMPRKLSWFAEWREIPAGEFL